MPEEPGRDRLAAARLKRRRSVVPGGGSVKKTLSHGMKTLSSHICASSSSKRLLRGAMNGFLCLTAILRHTTVTPAPPPHDNVTRCAPHATAPIVPM